MMGKSGLFSAAALPPRPDAERLTRSSSLTVCVRERAAALFSIEAKHPSAHKERDVPEGEQID